MSEQLVPAKPATLSEVDKRKAELLAFAASITITDQMSFEMAAEIRRDVRKVRDHYEELLRPGIQEAHALHKRLLEALNSKVSELDKVERLIKSQQDRYQEEKLRLELAEKARIEAEMQKARERILAEQLAQATATEDADEAEAQTAAVMERMMAPAPVLPMIHQPVKAAGASSRVSHTYTLLDPTKIDPMWLLKMVIAEIRLKGESVWLDRQIRREIEARHEGAEEIVGKGSIKYRRGVSTGVRR